MVAKSGNIRKAVIPVAGLGTRFLPVTRSVPKALLPVLGTPLIHYAVAEAAGCGIETVIIVISPGMESVGGYFGDRPELEAALEASGRTAPARAAAADQRDGRRGDGDPARTERAWSRRQPGARGDRHGALRRHTSGRCHHGPGFRLGATPGRCTTSRVAACWRRGRSRTKWCPRRASSTPSHWGTVFTACGDWLRNRRWKTRRGTCR